MAETHEFHFDDDGINSERIVNDEYQVTNEFFCTICQSLLWKPKSCASCQHLFCDKCIQKWKRINSTSCPFCCTQYEEKRVSPYIHSLLGRLSIRCRNSSFGCTEILSYNSLEQHETNECQYPTKQCHICGNYVLIDASDQHQSSCNPALIECRICKHLVDSESFSQHMSECFQTRLDDFIDRMTPIKTPAALPLQRNNGNTFDRLINLPHQWLSSCTNYIFPSVLWFCNYFAIFYFFGNINTRLSFNFYVSIIYLD